MPKDLEHWCDDDGGCALLDEDHGSQYLSDHWHATLRSKLAEVAVPRDLFRKILPSIDDQRPRPATA